MGADGIRNIRTAETVVIVGTAPKVCINLIGNYCIDFPNIQIIIITTLRRHNMKKVVFIMGLILILGACSATKEVNPAQPKENNDVAVQKTDAQEQKFVNPIFYQPLEPLSQISTWTYLTPTSIKSMTPLDKNKIAMTGQCELLENQENFIKLLCNTSWQMLERGSMVTNTSEDIYTYEIKEIFSDTCIKVEQVIYEITERGNEKLSISYYCISPSASHLESD